MHFCSLQSTVSCILLVFTLFLTSCGGSDSSVNNEDFKDLLDNYDKFVQSTAQMKERFKANETLSDEDQDAAVDEIEEMQDVASETSTLMKRYEEKGDITPVKFQSWKTQYDDFATKLGDMESKLDPISMDIPQQTDTDGDGIPDEEDYCKEEPGPATNNGCPVQKSTVDKEKEKEDRAKEKQKEREKKEKERARAAAVAAESAGSSGGGGAPPPVTNVSADADGDGIYDFRDLCPNTFGLPPNGCPPSRDASSGTSSGSTGVISSGGSSGGSSGSRGGLSNSGGSSTNSSTTTTAGTGTNGTARDRSGGTATGTSTYSSNVLSCTSSNSFSPFSAGEECSELTASSTLTIRPSKTVAVSNFYLVGSDNGSVSYELRDGQGNKLNRRSSGRVNAGPGMSQISLGDVELKANKNYILRISPNGELKLKTHSCAKSKFGNGDVNLTFSGEAFVHQINFCK